MPTDTNALFSELLDASFEAVLLHPGSTIDTFISTMRTEYADAIIDAADSDRTSEELLRSAWTHPYTDETGVTRPISHWARIFSEEDAVKAYCNQLKEL